jgi:hypothetical protein
VHVHTRSEKESTSSTSSTAQPWKSIVEGRELEVEGRKSKVESRRSSELLVARRHCAGRVATETRAKKHARQTAGVTQRHRDSRSSDAPEDNSFYPSRVLIMNADFRVRR